MAAGQGRGEGFGGGKAFLNDPAKGPTKITLDELNSSYSGVVLTFSAGQNFKKGGHRPSMWRSLRARLVIAQSVLSDHLDAGAGGYGFGGGYGYAGVGAIFIAN